MGKSINAHFPKKHPRLAPKLDSKEVAKEVTLLSLYLSDKKSNENDIISDNTVPKEMQQFGIGGLLPTL